MNIYDIATEAGVSSATVSRVLNGNKNVKDSTRRRVLKIIEEKHYVPNSLARNLSAGDSQNIALLAPDIGNPFFSQILHGLSDTAMKYGYNVFMYGTNDSLQVEHSILFSLKKEMIKGLALIPVSAADTVTKERLGKIRSMGIPIVLIDRDIEQSDFDGVYADDCESSKAAVQCLIGEGHRKIAIITGTLDSRPGRERLKGYIEAIEEAGIPRREEYIVNGYFKEKESYNAMKQLMELQDPPTAVFASNNMTSLGLLSYMKDHSMKLSRDVSVIGFDEIRELTCSNIELTVVDRPIYEMGCAALELLEYNFVNHSKKDSKSVVQRVNKVKSRLIRRGSEKYEKFNGGSMKNQ